MIAFIYVGTSLLTSAIAFYLGFNSGSRSVIEIQTYILMVLKQNLSNVVSEEEFMAALSKSTKATAASRKDKYTEPNTED